jgi:hypothetical protein
MCTRVTTAFAGSICIPHTGSRTRAIFAFISYLL